MKTQKRMTLKFYQSLGRLFYAIAAADKQVRKVEFNKLKELVREQWLPLDSTEDEYHSDAAYQIEIVFDWLNNEENLNAQACYDAFINYKNEQPHLFTEEVNSLILKTGNTIANAFAGINKSELMMLANLSIELKK
ncbi:hypothetical protein [Seonamhaeicola aphaedonensis]|uniref:Tellurite resistance protein TerB n=1 Tax=Seonamhaeicola aphaedonensis TaxID=1461338 RepID=A0A3D9HIL9_9FLAO|nr:hypothetical protein [Seonamhaeicola aphaedonensis]RED49372.1 hypothetical protein DFQ02_102144 [Seonamhaeicola aphaedonensis]